MASSFSLKINNLRKKSRILLSCLEENAKIVRKEVKNLRANDPLSKSYLKNRRYIYGRNSDIWKLRNDSSGVGAALSPDYFRLSPKYESLSEPDMNATRRMLLKSEKKYTKSSPQRRGIKECYCYTSSPDVKKIHEKSTRTKRKTNIPSLSEINARHLAEGEQIFARIDDIPNSLCLRRKNEKFNNPEISYSPPLSNTTLIRAQNIDYTPRSKFLRKVQSRVNSLRSNSSPGSQIQLTPKSPSPLQKKSIHQNLMETEINTLGKYFEQKNEFPKKHNCLCVENEANSISHRMPKKTLLPKKTIVSKKSVNDQNKSVHNCRPTIESPSQTKRMLRVIGKNKYISGETFEDRDLENLVPKNYEENCPCSYYKGKKFSEDISDDEITDSGINNIRKFRDKNYFDTHASNVSLLGSRSSGSVRQFRLNDRLFPEPMGRIHREDIVVSIPPCATRQKRTIHYFPRNVVKQEKNISHNNYTKKRSCPSCPLIGHAIDLGVLKVSHPTNSLALRYQKGIP